MASTASDDDDDDKESSFVYVVKSRHVDESSFFVKQDRESKAVQVEPPPLERQCMLFYRPLVIWIIVALLLMPVFYVAR
jgi:hypothetical protein